MDHRPDTPEVSCDMYVTPRTCLKCKKTQQPVSRHRSPRTDDNSDSSTCVILDANMFVSEGFLCNGEWLFCKDGTCERIIGLHSSIYNIQEDIDGYVCYDCFSSVNSELDLSVKCDVCLSKYEASIPGCNDQGYLCSSSMVDENIICSYGSYHDGIIYKWTTMPRPPEFKDCEVICDHCIDKLLFDKVITLSRNYM